MQGTYNLALKELDSAIGVSIKKQLKKQARLRASKSSGGSLLVDWEELRRDYTAALAKLLDNMQDSMSLAGVYKFCDYDPQEEVEE